MEIKANTRVVILAGNDYNPCTSMKNNISWFRGNQAEFNDLRFLGPSGRGLFNQKKNPRFDSLFDFN